MRTLIAIICLPAFSISSAATTISDQRQPQNGIGPFIGATEMIFRLDDNLSGDDQIGTAVFFAGVPVESGVEVWCVFHSKLTGEKNVSE